MHPSLSVMTCISTTTISKEGRRLGRSLSNLGVGKAMAISVEFTMIIYSKDQLQDEYHECMAILEAIHSSKISK